MIHISSAETLARSRLWSFVLGIVAFIVYGIIWLANPDRSLLPYLVAFVFWFDVAVGLLIALMIAHVMRSDWGRTVKPLLDATAVTFPLLGLLFVPILFDLHGIYEWTHLRPEQYSNITHLRVWYTIPFFVGRAVFYFVVWSAFGFTLVRWTDAIEPEPGYLSTHRIRVVAGWGLVLLALTSTAAAVDWVRSLMPDWHSSTFGLYFLTGQGLSGFAFIAVFSAWLSLRVPQWRVRMEKKPIHDVSKLMFASVILWTYIAFTQYLIIWSGNVPEESKWFVMRTRGSWQLVVIALVVLHFMVPFLLLLPRYTNRRLAVASNIAALVLVMRFVDVYWLIEPSEHPLPVPPYMAAIAIVAIGGVWMALVLDRLQRRIRFVLQRSQPEAAR